jgi:predicted DNA-binding transcriptional regulator AlpA
MEAKDMEHKSFPETGYLRLSQIIGNKKATPPIPAIIPVSKSTWWAGVKSGRYPQPVKLSERCTAWRIEDILTLIEQTSKDRSWSKRRCSDE